MRRAGANLRRLHEQTPAVAAKRLSLCASQRRDGRVLVVEKAILSVYLPSKEQHTEILLKIPSKAKITHARLNQH
ncbi:MAG: hypothetical protein RBR41_05460 [Desulfovibrio sp.]|uniref:hypothetical protein n=1 Tax=Desulfovibrio sp. TaxID=885 RepID=UPI002A367005|nr:hypothetical protein [Desulfovibrio sp.]MDY0259096.1 hypothetical protein [Desulfovibrio sp.]